MRPFCDDMPTAVGIKVGAFERVRHPGFVLKPLVVNLSRVPRVTQANVELGERFPELAVLSSLAHGNGDGGAEVVITTLGILAQIDGDRELFYRDYIWYTLSDKVRAAVEAKMEAQGFQYKTEFARKY